MKTLLFLLLLIPSDIVQEQPWINLKQYIKQNKMIDYGYGLWELDEELNEKYFNFNSLMSEQLLFRFVDIKRIKENNQVLLLYNEHKIVIQSNEALYFNEVDTTSIDTVSHISYKLNDVNILNINISFASYFDTAYLLHFAEKDYLLIYIKELNIDNPFQGTLSRYQGFLLDIHRKELVKLPKMQTTNSVLCFSDYDKNGLLDYINIDIDSSNIVSFYTLKDNRFTKDKYYIEFSNFLDMPFIKNSFLPNN